MCFFCLFGINSSTTVAGSSKGLTKYPMLYLQFWAPDDGRRNRLKHVYHFTEINNCVTLHLVGYTWKCVCDALTHEPQTWTSNVWRHIRNPIGSPQYSSYVRFWPVWFSSSKLGASYCNSKSGSGLADETKPPLYPSRLTYRVGPSASPDEHLIGQKLTKDVYVARYQVLSAVLPGI
jgi:hypothetical protein